VKKAGELPTVIGRYEIVRQIGVGAMGRVLLARDPVLGRHVAIKLLRDDLAIASDVRDALVVRMRHEARAAARVTHPNLVIIHDMGEDDGLGLYLVFEYLEGPTLKQRISEGRLGSRQAARIARELGAALAYAHDHGVLHRDVKPENIILSPTGTKLTDFGIARVPDSTLTHAGGLLGTPAYSAPETFREGKFSPESDQFSLAATLYEAISGARAFPGDDAVSVASKIANDAPAPFAEELGYPAGLDAILARGMAKSPDERFDTCKAFGGELMDALLAKTTERRHARLDAAADGSVDTTGALDLARVSGFPDKPSEPPAERNNWHVFLGGLAVLFIAGVFVRSCLRDTRSDAEANVASAEPSAAPSASVSAPKHETTKPRPSRPAAPRRDSEPEAADPAPSSAQSAAVSAAPSSSAPATTATASASAAAAPSASAAPRHP
jgi:serine/threonine-protein kinase